MNEEIEMLINMLTLHGNRFTRRVRIARVAANARADGQMVDDAALAVRTARLSARIDALVAHARPVARTVRADHALRPARAVRIALVVGRADALVAAGRLVFALSVRPARVRLARLPCVRNVRLD